MSSFRILKASAVTVDPENKVLIDIMPAVYAMPEQEEKEEPEAPERLTPHETAQQIIMNASRKAEAILKDALDEAEGMVNEAKQQAAREAVEIIETSKEQGYQDGLKKAQSIADNIRGQAEQELADARRERKEMEASLEPDMVHLIMQIVEKLLSISAYVNPDVVVNLVKQGLAGATLTGDVFIHVSQADYETVSENKEQFMALADGSVRFEIMRDLSLNPMDCVIETPYGNIDCSLGQQYESLRNNLLYILENNQ
jgi:flagellar assembly protein FliH